LILIFRNRPPLRQNGTTGNFRMARMRLVHHWVFGDSTLRRMLPRLHKQI
jgi:hypothetical protein